MEKIYSDISSEELEDTLKNVPRIRTEVKEEENGWVATEIELSQEERLQMAKDKILSFREQKRRKEEYDKIHPSESSVIFMALSDIYDKLSSLK